ncbi:YdhK family protein [Paenibacillus bovis]|uniref:DUF1541 domain-containing protein n=1 Tax=Paenibacillus bovis TaxID=1616788 RepID=A0A172ZJE0_9BACL|nr:YdhK family protein [Paenibacillus bovis]ANF97659.1 hypothetical protein AR543_17685 [Paenibacillus bovis]
MRKALMSAGIVTLLIMTGCSNSDATHSAATDKNASNTVQGETAPDDSMAMGNETAGGQMHHSGSAELPAGLQTAQNPEFPVGTTVIMNMDHMPGMKGAQATIAGAYDTTVYSVSYTPVTGGEPVKNHKWVIHEELQDAGQSPLKPGSKAILNADHMPGMKGAQATIDLAQQTTVYMVDYTPTNGGEPVRNHKWVTGEELSAK